MCQSITVNEPKSVSTPHTRRLPESVTKPNGQEILAEALLEKTKLCIHFEKGKCNRGQNCTFAHCSSELRVPPNFRKTKPCVSWVKTNSCRRGQACKYAHGENEMRDAVQYIREGRTSEESSCDEDASTTAGSIEHLLDTSRDAVSWMPPTIACPTLPPGLFDVPDLKPVQSDEFGGLFSYRSDVAVQKAYDNYSYLSCNRSTDSVRDNWLFLWERQFDVESSLVSLND